MSLCTRFSPETEKDIYFQSNLLHGSSQSRWMVVVVGVGGGLFKLKIILIVTEWISGYPDLVVNNDLWGRSSWCTGERTWGPAGAGSEEISLSRTEEPQASGAEVLFVCVGISIHTFGESPHLRNLFYQMQKIPVHSSVPMWKNLILLWDINHN